jgi:hypothetical protein
LHMTATTATPEAERTGLERKKGARRSRYCSGKAAMISISLGMACRPCLAAILCLREFTFTDDRFSRAVNRADVISVMHADRWVALS